MGRKLSEGKLGEDEGVKWGGKLRKMGNEQPTAPNRLRSWARDCGAVSLRKARVRSLLMLRRPRPTQKPSKSTWDPKKRLLDRFNWTLLSRQRMSECVLDQGVVYVETTMCSKGPVVQVRRCAAGKQVNWAVWVVVSGGEVTTQYSGHKLLEVAGASGKAHRGCLKGKVTQRAVKGQEVLAGGVYAELVVARGEVGHAEEVGMA